MIFDYPEKRSQRRHGPAGYRRCESYRPWLRDEFCFRCIYCLKREAWGQVTGEFELDHFEPQSVSPQRRLDCANLVYACSRCNLVKSGHLTNDPFEWLTHRTVTSYIDGSIASEDPETRRLLLQLDLDSPALRGWRQIWIRIVHLAEQEDSDLAQLLTGFPSHLPDLSRLKPPSNESLEGVDQSWHAKHRRGELPQCF
ncbi:HNH endonuclease [Novipirellula sp. SH528]|uniref:HNH endonuclease n=1 Tax=Novipirellula sp. SH528 TaxID=3454466 RepID=UPI003FA0DF4F